MALISMRQLLDHAAEHGYGIPAFNANNLEQAADFVQNRLQENGKVGEPTRFGETSWNGTSGAARRLPGAAGQRA